MERKLLKPASNQQAFGKVGILGFQGSGKTHTAMLIALGLLERIGEKDVAFFDTETGSDWWASRMPDGVELLQLKSRAFTDLISVIRECEATDVPVLLIDSITHVWRDLIDSYLRRVKRKRLRVHDWGPLKSTWGEYTDLFVNSRVHIIVCGRAGWEYEYKEDEDGDTEIQRVGTKMKAESEFGFEPSLVIEMELRRTGVEQGSKLINVAHVLKDRSDTINGESFIMPTFEAFTPHFSGLNIGGAHLGVDTSRSSIDAFDDKGDNSWRREARIKEEALEEIESELGKWFPGQQAIEKKAKGDIVEGVIGRRGWTWIKNNIRAEELRIAAHKIRWFLNECEHGVRDSALRAGLDDKGKIEDANAAPNAIRQIVEDYFAGFGEPPDEPQQEPEEKPKQQEPETDEDEPPAWFG